MTVFKGYMRIMKKNTGLILLYLGIFFGVTMALQAAAGKETYTSYESEKIKIGVVDKDNGPLAEGLVKWLEEDKGFVILLMKVAGVNIFKEIFLKILKIFLVMIKNFKKPRCQLV